MGAYRPVARHCGVVCAVAFAQRKRRNIHADALNDFETKTVLIMVSCTIFISLFFIIPLSEWLFTMRIPQEIVFSLYKVPVYGCISVSAGGRYRGDWGLFSKVKLWRQARSQVQLGNARKVLCWCQTYCLYPLFTIVCLHLYILCIVLLHSKLHNAQYVSEAYLGVQCLLDL